MEIKPLKQINLVLLSLPKSAKKIRPKTKQGEIVNDTCDELAAELNNK